MRLVQLVSDSTQVTPVAEVRELGALGVYWMFGDCPDLVLQGLSRAVARPN